MVKKKKSSFPQPNPVKVNASRELSGSWFQGVQSKTCGWANSPSPLPKSFPDFFSVIFNYWRSRWGMSSQFLASTSPIFYFSFIIVQTIQSILGTFIYQLLEFSKERISHSSTVEVLQEKKVFGNWGVTQMPHINGGYILWDNYDVLDIL